MMCALRLVVVVCALGGALAIRTDDDDGIFSSECDAGKAYGLDANGVCHVDDEEDGDLDEGAQQCACENPGHRTFASCTASKTCSCNGMVRLGYQNKWSAWKEVTGSIQCTNKDFGGDPWRNQAKECQCQQEATIVKKIKSLEEGAQRCACENPGHRTFASCTASRTCSCNGKVRLGYQSKWSAWKDVTGSIQCTNEKFGGDPWINQAKECQCQEEAAVDEECCLSCKPGATYGRDDSGRCRTDINKNGVLDRFANGECCDCDPEATYGRDKDGRCRTDVNKNGLLDRFAKDTCCADKDDYSQEFSAPVDPKSTSKITSESKCYDYAKNEKTKCTEDPGCEWVNLYEKKGKCHPTYGCLQRTLCWRASDV